MTGVNGTGGFNPNIVSPTGRLSQVKTQELKQKLVHAQESKTQVKLSKQDFQNLVRIDDIQGENVAKATKDLRINERVRDVLRDLVVPSDIRAIMDNGALNFDSEEISTLISKLDSMISNNTEAIDRRGRIDAYKLNTLDSHLTLDNISQSTRKIGEVTTKIDEESSKLSTAQISLIDAKIELSETKQFLKDTKASVREQIGSLQNYISKLESKKSEIDQGGLNDPISQVKGDNINQVIDSVKKNISSLETYLEFNVETIEEQISDLESHINSLETNISDLTGNISTLQKHKLELENFSNKENFNAKLDPAIRKMVEHIDSFDFNDFERSRVYPRLLDIGKVLEKTEPQIAKSLMKHIDQYFESVDMTVHHGKDSDKVEIKENLIESLINLIPSRMVNIPSNPQTKNVQISNTPLMGKIVPTPLVDIPKVNIDWNITGPVPIKPPIGRKRSDAIFVPNTKIPPPPPPPIKCDSFFVKDRPAFEAKLDNWVSNVSGNYNLMFDQTMFKEVLNSFDSSIIQDNPTYKDSKQSKELLISVISQVTGESTENVTQSFDKKGCGVIMTKDQLVKITTALKENSYSDLSALTKYAMKKMEVDDIVNFESGSKKSKKVEIGASVGASVNVSDVVKAIPLPGLGEALQFAVQKAIGDAKITGQLSIDGGVGLSAEKNQDGTVSFHLDFTLKGAALGEAEVQGGKVLDARTHQVSGSVGIQKRITYNFKDENEIKEFLNGNTLFRKVESPATLQAKQFSIAHKDSELSTTTKVSVSRDEKLEGINEGEKVSRKITEKVVKTKALSGVNSPSSEIVKNRVKIRDGDNVLTKMEVVSTKSNGVQIPQSLNVNLSFDTLKKAKKDIKIPELAQRLAQDFIDSMKGKNITFSDVKNILEQELTKLADEVKNIEGSLNHTPENKSKETDLKIVTFSTKSLDIIGFQIPFKPKTSGFSLDDSKTSFSLMERKSIGATVGIGDFIRVGAKGTSSFDKVIGSINKAKNLTQVPEEKKQKTLTEKVRDKVEYVKEKSEKVSELAKKAEKLLDSDSAKMVSSALGVEGTRSSLHGIAKDVNEFIDDFDDLLESPSNVGPKSADSSLLTSVKAKGQNEKEDEDDL